MPLHPMVAERLSLLDGIPSWPVGLADPAMRARIEAFSSWPSANTPRVPSYGVTAAGPHGPVPLRVYQPDGRPGSPLSRAGLIWLHGGGFTVGDLDMAEADWAARELAARADAVVISVDYRLAGPEVSYPVPLDDVVAAIGWARDQVDELHLDPARIVVGGASAGANLAAGATLKIRDQQGWLPAALLLVYPVLHAVLPAASPALSEQLAALPRMVRFLPEDVAGICEAYLGAAASSADGYAMPGIGQLGGLCATLVLNAEYDDLQTSGQAFTAALALAGCDVEQRNVPGMLHGFLNLPATLPPVGDALDVLADRLRRPRSTPTT